MTGDTGVFAVVMTKRKLSGQDVLRLIDDITIYTKTVQYAAIGRLQVAGKLLSSTARPVTENPDSIRVL